MKLACFCIVAFLIIFQKMVGAAPPNDNFGTAVLLSGTNIIVQGSNIDATKEPDEPDHAGRAGGKSVWWKWIAPQAGGGIIGTDGSSFDTILAVYAGGSVSALTEIASNDDARGKTSSLLAFDTTPGMTYFIVVDGYEGATGTIQLALNLGPSSIQKPANDNFTNAFHLAPFSTTATGSTLFATRERNEPDHIDDLGGASVWWRWQPPSPGRVTIDTRGSDFDTLLAVYTGSSLSDLVRLAANDDAITNFTYSAVTLNVIETVEYRIVVDGFYGDAGEVQLNLDFTPLSRLGFPIQLPDGTVRVALAGVAGDRYAVEASSNLTDWTQVTTITIGSDGITEFTDGESNKFKQRFYRTQKVQ